MNVGVNKRANKLSIWLISCAFFMLFSDRALAIITVTDCVIQQPIADASMTAAYFNINYELDPETAALTIPDPEALERVEIKALSSDVQIHKSEVVDGIASMERVSSLFIDKPLTELKPGSYHLMLIGLKQQPQLGEEYDMRIIFRFDPEQQCVAKVKSITQIQNNN